ncbi:MAG: DUF4040 domain-containing protein [Chlorobi bacterium]|nr:DUF4040 domain-containing protein [Chlorobiota bacterium]
MEQILIIVLGTAIILAAFVAMTMKSLISAIMAVGVVSLITSILYLVLQAPDVAMTEAAIGAGLSTIIFLYAMKKTRDEEAND